MSQENGVSLRYALREFAKQLADNALDWTDRHGLPGAVTVRLEGTHTIVVANEGPGWNATPEERAQLLSLARGSMSSKLWRLLTRGAAGLGLQAIAGAVASGGGRIIIETCNLRIILRPRIEDGLTLVEEVIEIDKPTGTEIRVEIDPAYPADPDALSLANIAIRLARRANKPPRLERTSPHWFDTDALAGLLYAQPPQAKLRDVIVRFDGTSNRALQKDIDRRFGLGSSTRQFPRGRVSELLSLLQSSTKQVKPQRLGALGKEAWPAYCDGYGLGAGQYETGARQPLATIPFLVECWVRSTAGDSGSHFLPADEADVRINAITVNRSPALIYRSSNRRRGREVVLNLNSCTIPLSLPRAGFELVLNITAPHVPILSSGKLVDLTPLSEVLEKTIEQAVKRAWNSAKREAKLNSEPPSSFEAREPGQLHRILEDAVRDSEYSKEELTVLSADRDPYRLDTTKGHQAGQWLAEMVERFLAPEAQIHPRGLHYTLSSAGDVHTPDGKPYINNNKCWEWLEVKALKPARWLGYVPFERIVDERNASPEDFLPPYFEVRALRSGGESIIVPGPDKVLPCFTSPPWPILQPYRIIFIGEKASLRPVLLPIAQSVNGEVLLLTGESSDTRIYELAARCAKDPRPSVILYFSDFDPGGHQMPISVARKLQGLRDLRFPTLDIRLYPAALTLAQVLELELPSTPLKPTERRADRWREVMGHEQTEIDALAALQPEVLREIALAAVKPFFDSTLAERTQAAQSAWEAQSREQLSAHAGYAEAQLKIELALELLQQPLQQFSELQQSAAAILAELEPPPIELPPAAISGEPPAALFYSPEDFLTTSRRLREHKRLNETSQP
jgi:hypothetical protein